MTVFADDNQTMWEERASLSQIRTALGLGGSEEGRYHVLRKNYRNSRPIAELARHFYVGQKTGIPDLPDRAGPRPRLVEWQGDLEKGVGQIARVLKNRPGQEVCVIVPDNTRLLKKVVKGLEASLAETRYKVQYYYNKGGENLDEELVFDSGDYVTVLNMKSAKGLEFDIIFLVELQEMRVVDDARDDARMNLYVMCSRARKDLFLCFRNTGGAEPAFLSIMPPERDNLLDYRLRSNPTSL